MRMNERIKSIWFHKNIEFHLLQVINKSNKYTRWALRTLESQKKHHTHASNMQQMLWENSSEDKWNPNYETFDGAKEEEHLKWMRKTEEPNVKNPSKSLGTRWKRSGAHMLRTHYFQHWLEIVVEFILKLAPWPRFTDKFQIWRKGVWA